MPAEKAAQKSPASANLRAPMRRVLLVLLLLLPATVPANRRSLRYELPIDRVDRYRFQTRHSVESEWLDGGTEPAIPPFVTEGAGTLERTVARAFRDGSFGLLQRFVGPGVAVLDPASGASRDLPMAELDGRSISMRLDDGGSLFDSVGWHTFSGAGGAADALGDVQLAAIQVLPVTVPDAQKGVPALFRRRVPLDPFAEMAQTWTIRYRRGANPAGCARCLTLLYSGEVLEDSVDRHPERAATRKGAGYVSGTVVLGPGRRLRSHTWRQEWKRDIAPTAGSGGRTLRQREVVEGSLVLQEAP
jgi:hypothetical protein